MSDAVKKQYYDSEEFRRQGHELIDILSDYLKTVTSRSETPVLSYTEPDDLVREFAFENPSNRELTLSDFVRKVIGSMNHLHHPRFVGHHSYARPLTAGIIAQMCTTLLEQRGCSL